MQFLPFFALYAKIGTSLLLTGFEPGSALAVHARVMLPTGMARVAAMSLLPLITMRLFVEERRGRTLEMLFTSPIGNGELILGDPCSGCATCTEINRARRWRVRPRRRGRRSGGHAGD